MSESSSNTQVRSEGEYATDVAAFQDVVSAMLRLDASARERLLTTVATFFGISGSALAASITRFSKPDGSRSGPDEPIRRDSFSEDRSISPKEFLLQKKPATDIEKVACLAYYLAHYRDTPTFKTLDLSKLNTEAAQVKLSNPTVAADNATKAGLLVPATKGNKQISAIGELYVQALPDRLAAKDAIAHARPRRKSRKSRSSPRTGSVIDG